MVFLQIIGLFHEMYFITPLRGMVCFSFDTLGRTSFFGGIVATDEFIPVVEA